jgi:uncharacterized membrane protein
MIRRYTRTGSTIALLLLFVLTQLPACSRQPVYPPAAQSGTDIIIDPANLEPAVPKFYTYSYRGKNISYFVLKDRDKVLSFLDACTGCYTRKRGYRYDDGVVICRYCNTKFPISKLEKGLGSCYPIKLGGRIENGKFLIPIPAVEAAVNQF